MPSSPVPAELSAGWQQVLERWSAPASHDLLLGLAAKHEQFPWLAARYRNVARTSPDDPIARDRLARVQRAAAALAFAAPASRGTPESRRYRNSALMLLTAVFATALCLWITNYRAQAHQHSQATTVVLPSR